MNTILRSALATVVLGLLTACGPDPAPANSVLIAGKAVQTNGSFVLRLPPSVAGNWGQRELSVEWSFCPPNRGTSLAYLEHTLKQRRRLPLEAAARNGLSVSLDLVGRKLPFGAGPQQFTDELITQFSDPDSGNGVALMQSYGLYGVLFVTFTNVTGTTLTLSASHYAFEAGSNTTIRVTPPSR